MSKIEPITQPTLAEACQTLGLGLVYTHLMDIQEKLCDIAEKLLEIDSTDNKDRSARPALVQLMAEAQQASNLASATRDKVSDMIKSA